MTTSASLRLGAADGSLGTAQPVVLGVTWASAENVGRLALADVDEDGDLDLLGSGMGGVGVALNTTR